MKKIRICSGDSYDRCALVQGAGGTVHLPRVSITAVPEKAYDTTACTEIAQAI